MIFGEVIQNCWRKRYSSIVELEYTITADLCTGPKFTLVVDDHELELRLKECQEFLQNANIDCGDEIQPADCNTVEKGAHYGSVCMGLL